MDNEHYITNIHAYWKHSQKERQSENAAASLSHKSQQSKLSAAAHSDSSNFTTLQPHDAYNQYLDHVDHRYDDDDRDDEERNPRYKGNRESQDQWYDEQDKSPRQKNKNTDQLDDVYWDEDYNFSN